jgi:ligand-binding sensor domain-containing protein
LQLCFVCRAESNAIWVGTAQISSVRLPNKSIEWFFHVLYGNKQQFSKSSIVSPTRGQFFIETRKVYKWRPTKGNHMDLNNNAPINRRDWFITIIGLRCAINARCPFHSNSNDCIAWVWSTLRV